MFLNKHDPHISTTINTPQCGEHKTSTPDSDPYGGSYVKLKMTVSRNIVGVLRQ